MTEVYVSKISDRTENFSETFIEESDTPISVENIQLCHLVTVEAQNHSPQALEVGDSAVTVGDSGDSLGILLEAAIADGPEAIQKIAAQYSPEVVREAIAQIKTKDPDAAEEIRDAIEVSSSTQMPEKVPSQQEVQPPSTVEEFAEQIKKAIANVDHPLAVQVSKTLRPKLELRNQVRAALTVEEFDNFRLLAMAGVIKGTRVKYVGDAKYAEQYEGLELDVYGMDEYGQITCRKPDGYLTTRMKPEELEKL